MLSLAEPAARPTPRGAPEGPPIVQKVSTSVASGCPATRTSTTRRHRHQAGNGGQPNRTTAFCPAGAGSRGHSTLPGGSRQWRCPPALHAPPAEAENRLEATVTPPLHCTGARRVTRPTATSGAELSACCHHLHQGKWSAAGKRNEFREVPRPSRAEGSRHARRAKSPCLRHSDARRFLLPQVQKHRACLRYRDRPHWVGRGRHDVARYRGCSKANVPEPFG